MILNEQDVQESYAYCGYCKNSYFFLNVQFYISPIYTQSFNLPKNNSKHKTIVKYAIM